MQPVKRNGFKCAAMSLVCDDQERFWRFNLTKMIMIFVLEEASISCRVVRNLPKILYRVKSRQYANNNHIFVEDSVI